MGTSLTYDVIIAGASFAGLAVAAQLRGKRVLLLDRKPVGTGQTSACGTLVCTLRALNLEETILQVHDQLVVHTEGRTFHYPVFEPFCTFDYALLCRRLQEQGDAEFRLAPARAVYGNEVETEQGAFRGRYIVDASGWRAVLGSQLQPGLVRRDRMNFGLETTVAYRNEGLHFWFDPQELLPLGIGWAFPAGDVGRIGVGSYKGESRLGAHLERFLSRLALQREDVHGGFFPYALREPVSEDLFLVGDAAGQCMGLTGEGIRPALFFGTQLGRLLRRAFDGETTPEEARTAYRSLVLRHRRGYYLLGLAQRVLPRFPLPVVERIMAFVNRPAVLQRILDRYLLAFRITSTLA
jgi:flavin-dependent dehydrogenase